MSDMRYRSTRRGDIRTQLQWKRNGKMGKWEGGGGGKGKTERQGRGVIALTMCEKAIRNYITLWLLKVNICIHTHTHKHIIYTYFNFN